MGVTDNWSTVSNGQPNIEQQIHWEMGTGNGWIGYTYGKDYGYMELKEDGTVNIHRIAEDGTVTDETGKFTIDEANKVIDIDIDVLCANTWIGTKSGKLNILSLTADGLQIALPDGDYGYSLNYYSQAKADADAQISVLLNIADSSWGGSWDEPLAAISPENWRDSTRLFSRELVPMPWCLRLTLPVWRSAIPIRLYALTRLSWTVLPFGLMPTASIMATLKETVSTVFSCSMLMGLVL